VWRRLELHDDLRRGLRQALAGAQVERHARPAHVVDVQSEGRVRFHRRRWCHLRLRSIAGHARAPDDARRVLPAHGVPSHGTWCDRSDGAQRLFLLITDVARIPSGRRLDGDQRAQLQEVVLHHVAQGARGLVIAPAPFDTERLGRRYLDVVDVVATPDGFEDGVREAQREEVLDDLLAQEMVDAIDVLLYEVAGDVGVEGAR
jgi:hypothetical protein